MIGLFEVVGLVLAIMAASILGAMLFTVLCLVLMRGICDAVRFLREGRELVRDQQIHLQGDRQVARTWKQRYELSEAQRSQAEAEVDRLKLYLGGVHGGKPPERALSGVVEDGPAQKGTRAR